MRKFDAYVAIYEFVKASKDKIDAEAFEVFEKDVQKMIEKNDVAKAESAAKAAARAEVLEKIIEILRAAGGAMVCKDIAAELDDDLTAQKVSYILKEGVANGKLERVEDGKSVAYAIAG